MFAQSKFPDKPLLPEQLDLFLSNGWFRMEQTVFTSTYLHLDNQFYRVFWLRVALADFVGNKILQKISRLCSNFEVRIQKAVITPEKEELFQCYKTGIAFQPSESLEKLLYNGSDLDIYNTFEVAVYDGNKLIAVGFFDIGKDSAAGISSFYDPAYKKFSLGKFLIYQKMLFCKSKQISHFYPGYVAPGCKAFDYKLDIGKDTMEYFDLSSGKWVGINSWDAEKGSILETIQKLEELQQELSEVKIENQLFLNNHFQANLYKDLHGFELFDYLYFVNCFPYNPEVVNPIIVFDIRDRKYHLLKCISVGRSKLPNNKPEEFYSHLLKIVGTIYSTNNAHELAEKMAKAFAYV